MDETLQVSYFVLCDSVITEENTRKQSLIGIYSGLSSQQFPFHINAAVALCIRVQSPNPRRLNIRLLGPDGSALFITPELPFNWSSVREGLRTFPFAVIQIAINLNMIPISKPGSYLTELICEDKVIATYPFSVIGQTPAPGHKVM